MVTSAAIELLDYQLPDYLAQHPGLVSSLTWGLAIKALVPPGCGAMLHTVMHATNPALAKAYFLALSQGIELQASDPPYLIREKFLHERKELHHTAVCTRAASAHPGMELSAQRRPNVAGQAPVEWG